MTIVTKMNWQALDRTSDGPQWPDLDSAHFEQNGKTGRGSMKNVSEVGDQMTIDSPDGMDQLAGAQAGRSGGLRRGMT